MNIDDLRYQLTNLATDAKYRLDDLMASTRAKLIAGLSALALVLAIVFAVVWIPRISSSLTRPSVEHVRIYRGDDETWVSKARALIENDPDFAHVEINTATDEQGNSIILISGTVADIARRVALAARLKELGQPENLTYELDIGPPPEPESKVP